MVEWREAPGYPDYMVSEYGAVMRVSDGSTRKAGFMPSGRIGKGGYRRYKLSRDGVKREVYAHRLVCEAWHGPQPDGCQVAHWDGNPMNNHHSNLRWATPAENLADRNRHGTATTGEKNGRSILTADQVAQIRTEFTGAYGQVADLSRRYGTSHSAMLSVCKGEHWQEGL